MKQYCDSSCTRYHIHVCPQYDDAVFEYIPSYTIMSEIFVGLPTFILCRGYIYILKLGGLIKFNVITVFKEWYV